MCVFLGILFVVIALCGSTNCHEQASAYNKLIIYCDKNSWSTSCAWYEMIQLFVGLFCFSFILRSVTELENVCRVHKIKKQQTVSWQTLVKTVQYNILNSLIDINSKVVLLSLAFVLGPEVSSSTNFKSLALGAKCVALQFVRLTLITTVVKV